MAIGDLEQIKSLIHANVPEAEIVLQNGPNDTHHLYLLVISDFFKGKMLIDQHQLVMNSLKDKFNEDLHAIQIKTITKEKYSKGT